MDANQTPISQQEVQKKSSKKSVFLLVSVCVVILLILTGIVLFLQNKRNQTIASKLAQQKTTAIKSISEQAGASQHKSFSDKESVYLQTSTPFAEEQYAFYKTDITGGNVQEITLAPKSNVSHVFLLSHSTNQLAMWTSIGRTLSVLSAKNPVDKKDVFTQTDFNGYILSVMWSSDDKKIAFLFTKSLDDTGINGNKEVSLYTVNSDGSNLQKITSYTTKGYAHLYGYSAETNSIVWERVDNFDTPKVTNRTGKLQFLNASELYPGTRHWEIVDAGTGKVQKSLDALAAAAQVEPGIQFTKNLKTAYFLQYRHENGKIAQYFVTYNLTDLKEESAVILGDFQNPEIDSIGRLQISPIENVILVLRYKMGSERSQVYLYDLQSKQLLELAKDTKYVFYPNAWSADGKYIWADRRDTYDKTTHYIIDAQTGEIEVYKPKIGRYFSKTDQGEESKDEIELVGFIP